MASRIWACIPKNKRSINVCRAAIECFVAKHESILASSATAQSVTSATTPSVTSVQASSVTTASVVDDLCTLPPIT